MRGNSLATRVLLEFMLNLKAQIFFFCKKVLVVRAGPLYPNLNKQFCFVCTEMFTKVTKKSSSVQLVILASLQILFVQSARAFLNLKTV